MPEIASMTDDLPVDCYPIVVRSTRWRWGAVHTQDDTFRERYLKSLEAQTLQLTDDRDDLVHVLAERHRFIRNGAVRSLIMVAIGIEGFEVLTETRYVGTGRRWTFGLWGDVPVTGVDMHMLIRHCRARAGQANVVLGGYR
jgi:hypothetical protein